MKKIIIRKRASVHPTSNYINKHYNKQPPNVNTLLNVVYEDDESYTKLQEEYTNALKGLENDFFMSAYLIDNKYAVVLDSHITLYKLCTPSKEEDEKVIPWRYYSRSKYLGDTWWFSDDEIIQDLHDLPILAFMTKYKGI